MEHYSGGTLAEAAAQLLNASARMAKIDDFVNPESTRRQGPCPVVLRCDCRDREPRAVVEKILSLVEDQTFRLSDFAVLCPTNALCDRYLEALASSEIPCVTHREDSFDIMEDCVKVMTIHSAKGIEFPVVFLVGLCNGILPANRSSYLPDETEVQGERDRLLMYVGMTRAAEGLYLVCSDDTRCTFVDDVVEFARIERFVGFKH